VDYQRRATHLAARYHLCLYLLPIDGCPIGCLPGTTQQVNYAFLPTGPAYGTDFTSAATTHTVPALPSMTLSVEPVPTHSVPTGPTPTQPVPTMTEHVLTMTQHVFTRPVMPVHTLNKCAPTTPGPTIPVLTMNEHTLTMPSPTVPVLAEHALTMPMYAMPMHTMSQSTVPAPTLPDGKVRPDTSSIVLHFSTLSAPVINQPQVVLVKQFQPPKPYTGASSWKGYREYFERLAAMNGWTTVEQKVEQLALAL